jgi:deoxyribonuclease IV
MVFPNTFERLHIGPSGMPAPGPGGALPKDAGACDAVAFCLERGWDTMELAFVHNVYLKPAEAEQLAALSRERRFPLSAHGSYYINLASVEREKIGASRARIVQAAERIAQAGGHSVVYHSAFYTGRDPLDVHMTVIEQTRKVEAELRERDIRVWLRPELTGKPTQHGEADELIKLANSVETVLPCIDWAHLHARTNGAFNSYDEWCTVLDRLERGIRNKNVLQRMHMHLSGIEYGPKGEKRHIPLATADLRYKELMQALKQAGVCGTLVVEAPAISQHDDLARVRDAWERA